MAPLASTSTVLVNSIGMLPACTAAVRPAATAFARLRTRSHAAGLGSPVLSNLAQQRSITSRSQYSNHSVALTHTLHVQSTRNNVLLTFSDESGRKVFKTITGGSDKDFKKAHRSSYEAAHQAAIKMFTAITDWAGITVATGADGRPLNKNAGRSSRDLRLRVAFKGMFGKGREAVAAALTGPEGVNLSPSVKVVEDRTPIKIGGTRPRKARRL